MDERGGENEDTGFLPPEPAGPEPELGDRPPQAPPPHGPPLGAQPPGAQPPPPGTAPPPPGTAPPPPGTAPPPGAQPQGPPPGTAPPHGPPPQGPPPGTAPPHGPPPPPGAPSPPGAAPPGYGYPPPPPGQPAPGYGYPPPPGQAYPPPPGYAYPPGAPAPPGYAYPPPWGYPQQRVPDNGPAVAGFVFSLVSGGLLIISGGFSSIISIACAIVGIVYSRKGKRKVDAGETPKHRGLAQAGVIIGWVSLALSLLATIAWTLVLVFAITDDNWDWGTEPDTVRATAAVLGATARFIGT